MILEFRVIFKTKEEAEKAEFVLEQANEDIDDDSGDIMMISKRGLQLLDDNEIDYEEVV